MNQADLPETFRKNVRVQPNGCWFWTGSRYRNNPIYKSGEVHEPAFAFAWAHKNGPRPKGYGLYRGCQGIACANPDHRVLLPEGLGKARSALRVSVARKRREAREFFEAEAKRLSLPAVR